MMAQQGYIVMMPNRRGTTAFGQEWKEQISGDYSGLNMQDYLSAGRWIKSKPYVGTLACVGILYMKKRSQSAIMSVNSIPLLNADIVTGIALMLLFVRMFGNLNFTTMLIAHISFNIPYVVLNVLPKLRQRDKSTYEAAVDLGATPVQAFFKVIVPDIFPGILSGFLMAFTMSLDDFTITYFTKGAGIKTLSIIIYTERKLGNQPELYALSTIIFLIVLIVLFAVNRISINKEKSAAKGKNY